MPAGPREAPGRSERLAGEMRQTPIHPMMHGHRGRYMRLIIIGFHSSTSYLQGILDFLRWEP